MQYLHSFFQVGFIVTDAAQNMIAAFKEGFDDEELTGQLSADEPEESDETGTETTRDDSDEDDDWADDLRPKFLKKLR